MQISCHPVPYSPRQKLTLPKGTRFLAVAMDMRNNVGLWSIGEPDNEEVTVEVVMARLNQDVTPPNANYVGNYKDNSGVVFVFVNTAVEQPKPVEVVAKKRAAVEVVT